MRHTASVVPTRHPNVAPLPMESPTPIVSHDLPGTLSNLPIMTPSITHPLDASKFIFRGVHLDLTDALKCAAEDKVARLLRHNEHIIRIRIDLEFDKTRGAKEQFIAKGHLEIAGPDLIASVSSDDGYKSLDLLMDKLDGLLRARQGRRKDKRNHPSEQDVDFTKV